MKFFSRRTLLLLALAAFVVLAGVVLRTFMAGPYLDRAISAYLDKEYGLHTTIGSYGGNLVRSFLFKDVVLSQKQADAPQLHAAIDTIRVRYFLPALIHGLDPFLKTLVISSAGVECRIDSRGKAPETEVPFRLEKYLPASLPRLQIKDAAITILADTFSFTSVKTSIKIGAAQGGSQPVLLSGADVELKIAGMALSLASLRARLSYAPQILALEGLDINGAPVAGQARAEFNTAANTARVSGRFGQAPAHVAFTGEGGANALTMQVDFEKWPLPAKLIKEAAPSLPPLAGLLTGTIKATMAPARLLQTLESEVALSIDAGRLGPVSYSANLAGTLQGDHLVVNSGRLEVADSTIIVSKARLTVPASAATLATTPFTANLSLDSKDLAQMATLAQFSGLRGQAAGSVKLHGTLADPQAEFSLTARNFSYQNYPVGLLVADGLANRQAIIIHSLDFTSGPDQMHLAGQYNLPAQQFLEFSGKATIADIAAYRAFLNLPQEVSGRLLIAANQSADGKLSVKATADNGFYGKTAYDHLSLVVQKQEKNNYRLQAEASAESGQGSLTGDLEIDPRATTLRLGKLSLARQEQRLDLAHPATITLNHQDQVHIDRLTLRGKTETITINGTIAGKTAHNLIITATGLESSGWLTTQAKPEYSLTGGTLHLALTGTRAAPQIMATGTVAALHVPQLPAPFAGSFAFNISASGITITTFDWQNKNAQRIVARGRLPYDLFQQEILATPLDLQAEFTLPQTTLAAGGSGQDKPASANLSALLRLSGTLRQPQGIFTAEVNAMALPFLPDPLASQIFSGRCNISLAKDQLVIKTCRLESRDFAVTGSGRWTDFTDLGDLFTTRDIHALPGDLDLQFTVKAADIGWLAAKHPTIRRLKGQIEATLLAQGPAANPALSGTMSLRDGELRFRTMLPAMEGLAAQVTLTGHTVRVKNLSGQLGGAPFSISGSLIREDSGLQVEARLEGQNILFFRDEGMKVRGDTVLTMQGPLANMHLSGDIWLTDSRYSRNVDFLGLFRESSKPQKVMDQLFSLSDPPWRDMHFKVSLHSRQPFQLRNNLAKGSFRPELLLTGTGELPVLSGEVYINATTVTVPAGKVIVNAGVIRFSEQEPDLPAFNLSAKAKLAGYDISMQLQGTADEPIVTLSSIPPLPEDELLLLVLTGAPPKNSTSKGRTSTAGMNMAVYLGKGLLAKWFGGDSAESDESILDRLDLDTGREISQTGENTVQAEFRLADGILYPLDQLVLTSEKDIYDNFNAGIKIIFRFQ
jgi:autotransporter translocation and assembly factor TamB